MFKYCKSIVKAIKSIRIHFLITLMHYSLLNQIDILSLGLVKFEVIFQSIQSVVSLPLRRL